MPALVVQKDIFFYGYSFPHHYLYRSSKHLHAPDGTGGYHSRRRFEPLGRLQML